MKAAFPGEAIAGYSVDVFCGGAGFSRTLFYGLEGELRPKTAKIGARTIVRESPREYLDRIAKLQAEQASAIGRAEPARDTGQRPRKKPDLPVGNAAQPPQKTRGRP